RPLVRPAGRERGEDLSADDARADAVARVAEDVVDGGARHGAEERKVIGGHVDRAAPRPLHTHAVETRQEASQARPGPPPRPNVAGEPSADPPPRPDPAAAP